MSELNLYIQSLDIFPTIGACVIVQQYENPS